MVKKEPNRMLGKARELNGLAAKIKVAEIFCLHLQIRFGELLLK
tara:strand:+ start:178 stop:309 length:132 start_codon:yes stop_codon:yes gene_type:complete